MQEIQPLEVYQSKNQTSLSASSTITVLAETLAFKIAMFKASLGSSTMDCFLRLRLGLAAEVEPPRTLTAPPAVPEIARATELELPALLLTQDAPATRSSPTAAAKATLNAWCRGL